MLWVFLLLAVGVMLLAATNRLEAIDARIAKFFRKVGLAWQYFREDCEDIEFEIREQARRGRAPDANAKDSSNASARADQ